MQSAAKLQGGQEQQHHHLGFLLILLNSTSVANLTFANISFSSSICVTECSIPRSLLSVVFLLSSPLWSGKKKPFFPARVRHTCDCDVRQYVRTFVGREIHLRCSFALRPVSHENRGRKSRVQRTFLIQRTLLLVQDEAHLRAGEGRQGIRQGIKGAGHPHR